jgi:hypothetical protein
MLPQPTALGLWAITPAPMTTEQVADLVARARAGAALSHDRIQADNSARESARWAAIQAKERARASAAPPPAAKRRRGRAGEPSAISPRARAILARTKIARADDRIPPWLMPTGTARR